METVSGRVRGVRAGGVAAFLGIPYGAAADGERRFTAPRPVEAWTGELDATVFGPASPQVDPRLDASDEYYEVLRLLYPGSGSPLEGRPYAENSLVLNVWAPADSEPGRPVMVWLHGGAYAHGTGAEGMVHGDRLAAGGDVVVVSINHRLGLLGFLPPAPELGEEAGVSGVAGLLDIVQALRWVRENIAQFGGDPGNVTVFGESGGGSKVSVLMAMERARGLFHKAIIQSSPGAGTLDAEEAARNLADLLCIAGLNDARGLRELPVDRLMALQRELMNLGRRGPLCLAPVLHETELPEHPFAGQGAPRGVAGIPLVIGSTTHEFSTILARHPWYHRMTDAELPLRFSGSFGDAGGELLDHYRELEGEGAAQLVLSRAWTDGSFTSVMRRLRAVKARQPAPVYSYRFDYRTEVLDGVLGAHHSLDLPFT